MTQRERVLKMLQAGSKTYKDFLRSYIPEYRSRINELRKQGHIITSERFENGKKWTLHEGQGRLL
jgi:hypothetical protein